MNAKAALKQAREAIDSKNFVEALKLTKNILKADSKHYVALVYAALASQELGSKENAEHYYEQAIKIMPTNNLAWQGLVNFYDKCLKSENDPDLVQKLLMAYTKQVEIDCTANEKILKIVSKIERPQLVTVSFNAVIETLTHLASLELLSNEVKQKIQESILKLLSNNILAENYYELLETCYKSANQKDLSETEHLAYLGVLYAKDNITKVNECLNNLSTDYLTILDWQCEIFNKLYVLSNDEYKVLLESIKVRQEKIASLETKSSKLTGIILRILTEPSGTLLEIKDELEDVVNKYPSYYCAWMILTECYIALRFDQEAINAVSIARKLLTDPSKAKYLEKADLLMCYSFCKSQKDDELLKVIEYAEKVTNTSLDNTNLQVSVLEAYLLLKQPAAAKDILKKLEKNSDAYHLMKALIDKDAGDTSTAINDLEQNILNTFDYWLMLGDLYWPAQANKSLVAYLKATKANPLSFICYERLGRFYLKAGDYDKAKRCYEKSFRIKPSKIVCVELSKIYRKLQKWDENLSLLLTLTSGNISIENSWAFFQLGIHHYEREDFTQALNFLRLVIRVDSENIFCWECIGDCYFACGAYTSALKCYQKVKTINVNALYPMLQIANIKKLLGEFVDAQQEFELILDIDKHYIPALKGVAETCYFIAKQHYHRQLYGLARDALQLALNYVSRALHIKGSLSCCWKIAADCCYTASLLPFKYAFLSVSAIINTSNHEDSCLLSDELLRYAIQLYCKTLSFNQTNVNIYHDLACCYAQYSKLALDKSEKEQFLKHALTIIKHCISNDPNCATHWNVLGCIFFQLASRKPELSQHAFIKALTLDRNNVMSWTNLGTLYLCLNELKLANSVFSQAQKSNPNYVNCWIGQALIAEACNMEEAMDLFRHTMELSYHPEGSIGYAHFVCKTLMTKRRDEVIYEIDNMHAVPVACDGLRWYVENNPHDACGWNLYGILNERLGLILNAKEAFGKAAKYSKKSEALTNLARALFLLNDYPNAKKCYEKIPERNVNSEIGYALTLFKAENYEQAYEAYETALNSEQEGKNIQSDLLVALASMNYMFGGPEPTKDLLFQSTQLKTRSPWSLYAVLSLGLLHDDLNLATLTLEEIKSQATSEEHLKHYANLLVYTFLIQGKYQLAVSQLSAMIHMYPASSSLWFALSALLYRIRDVKPMDNVITKCAQASLKLKGNNTSLSMVLPMVTAACVLSGNLPDAVKSAQRQVHYYPNDDNANQILRVVVNAA